MKVQQTILRGVCIIEPKVFGDERGFFKETFHLQRYIKTAEINFNFVQDNYSRSRKGVLRGLHFQKTKPQGKLVSCVKGEVLDVAVDINPKSETCGKHVAVVLSDENHRQLWIPPGYAHGFLVLSDSADFMYKCTDYYDPNDESGIAWNDKELAIKWPESAPSLSSKDLEHPTLTQHLSKNSLS